MSAGRSNRNPPQRGGGRLRSRLDPLIFGVRLSALYALYRQRLRHHGGAELLAASGIAVGVALVLGVLVANSSVLGSTRAMTHEIDGSASLRLAARSSHGFPQQLAYRASHLPGVRAAASLLRQSAAIEGPKGRATIQLVGVSGLIGLKSPVTRNLGSGTLLLTDGLGLPSGVAEAIGADVEHPVTLLAAGAVHRVPVRAVLDSGAIGALAESGVAVTLLRYAQRIAGEPGMVSEVLVRPAPGRRGQLQRELRSLAAGRLDVTAAANELHLLEETAKPTNQSTTLFAAISVMVGFLLTLNAMLLTVPERRRQLAEMREQGYDASQVLTVFASQAVVLGLLASLAGVLAGGLLASTVFHQAPLYLSVAFPVSGHQEISLATVLIAMAAGVIGTAVTAIGPVLDMLSREPDAFFQRPGDPGQAIGGSTVKALSVAGVLALAAVTAAIVLFPPATIAGGVVLALVALCFVPLAYRGATRGLEYVASRHRGGMVAMTVIELNATATRAVALAGVAALAVFGSTAVGGARGDLINGLDSATVEFFHTADLWVTTPTNDLGTTSFKAPGLAAKLARLHGIASVRTYQSGLLDVGRRRLWVRARPAGDPAMLQAKQVTHGDVGLATRRLRSAQGWIAVSNGLASELHARVGTTVPLPTPSGEQRFRVAAITNNVGWPPGAITLSSADYARYWQTSDPSALEIGLAPGLSPAAGKRIVARALRALGSGLRVQTSAERITQFENNARQGLRSLSEISRLLLVLTALALAGALGTVIYQRRTRLAALKAQGFDQRQLWRALLLEGVTILVIGCLDGAALGVYGHALASRFLRISTGFPAPFAAGEAQILITLLLLAGVSLVVIALPGYRAAGVSTEMSFQE